MSLSKLRPATAALLLMLCLGCGGGSGAPSGGPVTNPGGGQGSGGGGGSTQNPACTGLSVGQGASLNGFRPFPADNAWNQDISTAPVDPNSSAIISFIGPSVGMHADFGSGQFQGSNIGIPYVVVGPAQAKVNVTFTAFGNESDPPPMPIPSNSPIEGDPSPGGDRHVLVVDAGNCWLYELFSASANADGSWNAGSAAIWDMLSNQQRPWTWTSADAAGLPIFPGLTRYDEAASGQINHALRFTLAQSRAAIVPPASHWAANSGNALAAPMGMRLRLKANFDVSTFGPRVQTILTALKKYGMIMADNGSSMFLSGAPDSRWDNNELHALSQVSASAFEVVQMNPLYTATTVPVRQAPVITSFSATPASGSSGTSFTLNWQVSNASYLIISPQIGPVRGNSIMVSPFGTTSYTLYATNASGRVSASTTVTVQ